jgi:hypothetical protein
VRGIASISRGHQPSASRGCILKNAQFLIEMGHGVCAPSGARLAAGGAHITETPQEQLLSCAHQLSVANAAELTCSHLPSDPLPQGAYVDIRGRRAVAITDLYL